MWDLSVSTPLQSNSLYPMTAIQEMLDEAPLNVLFSPH